PPPALPPPAHRRCADRPRTPGPPPPRFRGVGYGPATRLTHHAHRASAMVRPGGLLRSGRARLPAAGGGAPTRGDRAWAARGLRREPRRLRPDDGRTRLHCDRDHAGAGLFGGRGAALCKAPDDRNERGSRGKGEGGAGTVFAVGLVSPLVLVDEGINALARAFGEKGVGLVLAGSGAALVIAYVIRFLAIAIGFAQAGFSRISMELDDVARP